ncbi:hypothetical protein ABFY64_31390 [Pseudomonas aeruginosa]
MSSRCLQVLFLVNAAVALLGLAVASALPDMTLRGPRRDATGGRRVSGRR